jgi:hypothetical protein
LSVSFGWRSDLGRAGPDFGYTENFPARANAFRKSEAGRKHEMVMTEALAASQRGEPVNQRKIEQPP